MEQAEDGVIKSFQLDLKPLVNFITRDVVNVNSFFK